jgi:hypothetical protein
MQIQRMKMTKRKNYFFAQLPLLTVAALLTSLTGQPTFAADEGIYKTVAADGSIVFADKPSEDTGTAKSAYTETVANSEPVIDTSIRSDEFSSDTLGGRNKRPANVSAVEIISPSNNQRIGETRNSILFQIALGPDNRLPKGHSAQVFMDGEVISSQPSKQVNVKKPESGSYTYEVRVIDPTGVTLLRSAPILLHIE